MLNKEHYKILQSLSDIRKHNLNGKNFPIRFQSSRFRQEDIEFLFKNKYIKTFAFNDEIVITRSGEYELKNKY